MECQHIRGKRISAVMLCVLLSLLLHLLLALLLVLSSSHAGKKNITQTTRPTQQRLIRVQRKLTPQPEQQRKEQQKQLPFAKTSADAPQMLPERADFEGSRNTRASSSPDAEHLRSEKEAPAQRGEKKDEPVTFDQTRQDGDLNHEGQQPQQPPAPPQPPAPDNAEPALPHPPEQPAPGQKNAEPAPPQPEATDRENRPAPITPAAEQLPTMTDGELMLRREEKKETSPLPEPPATATTRGTATGSGQSPTLQKKQSKRRPAFFDPSLASPQPDTVGFRTTEWRSRSSGRFVMGRGASLNVTATPLGRYESEIYRRIAYYWYRACDEHRGDIIPGSITISLRINKRGYLENMDLVRRHGAGVIQQSFTFRAIRQAALPPMPATVRQEIVGELLELIFTFNFD